MFRLKYKITDEDVKSLNMSEMEKYVTMYGIVSAAGLAAGITAITLNSRTEIFVLGIILTVLAAILSACTIMLVIAPKLFVTSALVADNDIEREVTVDEKGITVSAEGQSDIIFDFAEVCSVKLKKTYIVCGIGVKETVLMLKDAITTGQPLAELYEFIKQKCAEKHIDKSAAGSTDKVADENKTDAPEKENADGVESVGDTDGDGEADKGAEAAVADSDGASGVSGSDD